MPRPSARSDAAPILLLDPTRNLLRCGEQEWRGAGRWEVLLLCELQSAGDRGLELHTLQAALRQAGQGRAPDRTGLRRLLMATEALVEQVLGPARGRHRIRSAPRRRTVGPWFWHFEAGESWRVQARRTRATVLPTDSVPRLPLVCTQGKDLPELTGLLIKSDSLGAGGELAEARRYLRRALALPSLSPEMRAVLRLREAKWAQRGGQHDAAQALMESVWRESGSDLSLRRSAELALLHLRYQRDVASFDAVDRQLSRLPWTLHWDCRNLAQQSSLSALLQRRRAMRALRGGHRAAALRHLAQSAASLNAAIYLCLTERDYEYTQNYLLNLALVHGTAAEAGDTAQRSMAFACYRAMILCWDELGLGGDSVWDFIGIANLWLEHPEQRAEFGLGLAYVKSDPAHLDFYVDTLARAEALGEPRQQLHAAVNLLRFACERRVSHGAAHLESARALILGLLQTHPPMRIYCQRELPLAWDIWNQ
ncbi:hypothetical protein HNQ51_003120 [Inhella inkyongensis]|uniref:Uncharacterized protein n=1 Tax=Inhella inkyongensis TaxID=392593 RepID=A0A840S7Z6_9BURK|nr:hypothetical protein [Inhella inkyongensis]MBB5205793.1 hypothetical protein [Inhella inkyongensis]